MVDQSIIFQNVSFKYCHATEPLVRNLSTHFARGWTGIVGANGVGKSTILKLATGELNPQYGRVIIPDFAIYCQQRTDKIPAQLNDLIQTINGDAMKIRNLLGIEDDWVERWYTLSHGE